MVFTNINESVQVMEPHPKDVLDMVTVIPTLDIAEGAIEANGIQTERFDELTERLARGDFHVHVEGGVPCKCIDGRPGARGLAPNAAGGTESIMVADDLTTKRFASEDGTTLGAYRNILNVLRGEGQTVGGHTDSHAQGDVSGCGANDKLPLIYDYISRRGDELRSLTEALGVVVNDEAHGLILANATGRSSFSTGGELLGELRGIAGEEAVDPLTGSHNEAVAVINLRSGTTLNREALAVEFGNDYQAFNVDAWSFAEAAEAVSLSEEEANQKVVAMAYYNLATAGVLCGKGMRVVIMR